MKKIVCAMLCILLVFSLSACCGNVNEVNTHNVESEIYSEEDIATAIDTIKRNGFFVVYSLTAQSGCSFLFFMSITSYKYSFPSSEYLTISEA